jgi:hydrogenase maturation factor
MAGQSGKEGEMIRRLRKRIGVLTALMVLAAWPALQGTPVALAVGDLEFRELEGLIAEIDPTSRTLAIWDYTAGLKYSGLQVEGTVDLGELKRGDYVLVRMGVNNNLITEIQLTPPPQQDELYDAAVRQLLGSERSP